METYQEAIDYLYERLPMFQRVGRSAFKPSLDNIKALCVALGNPEQKFPSIHIAGTNGKGSTAHTLAAIWQSAGYKVGLYTSPHLKSFTERMRINGNAIPKADVLSFVKQVTGLVESLNPSFFELTVAMAFDYFAKQNVDIAMIEVGMGGRLDSTNIIFPILSVITNISFDHQEFLGDTLPKIAGEKAGIIKSQTPVVISEYQSETEPVFRAKAKEHTAPIYFANDYYRVYPSDNEKVIIEHKGGDKFELIPALKGGYQQRNLMGVVMTCKLLAEEWKIEQAHIIKGIEQVNNLTQMKGRWQVISHNPLTVCDTAHNEAGIKELVNQIKTQHYQNLHLILGFTIEKSLEKLLPLYPKIANYYFCQFEGERSLECVTLHQEAKRYALIGKCFDDVNQALHQARQQAGIDDLIVISGSTFIVADLEEL